MGNLIKAEFYKLKKLTAYKALLIIYLIIEIGVQINNISNSVHYPEYNPTYTGMEWLSNPHQTLLLYLVAIFIFTAFYVNGDFTGHTFYSSLLCGIPRKNAFWSKIIPLFAGVLPLMLIYSLTGAVLWSAHTGFGMDFGAETLFLIAKAFVRQILVSLMLISHAVFFAVIAKSKIGTFGLSFITLYIFGMLRGNVENIVHIAALSKIFMFLLSLFYLNFGTFLASILLKLITARYIFERTDI